MSDTKVAAVSSMCRALPTLWTCRALVAATTNLLWRVKFSYSAGFTGGTPGATRVPSATDEGLYLGSGTDAAPTGTAMFAADAGYRFHCAAGGAAEAYTYISS